MPMRKRPKFGWVGIKLLFGSQNPRTPKRMPATRRGAIKATTLGCLWPLLELFELIKVFSSEINGWIDCQQFVVVVFLQVSPVVEPDLSTA